MEDKRDLRNPQEIGNKLLGCVQTVRNAYGEHIKLSEIWDVHVQHLAIPNYPQDELLSTSTARQYRRELEERAAAGDKYAKSLLETGEPLESS